MTGILTLILTMVISLAIVLAVVVYQSARRRRLQLNDLHQRLQRMERREIAANNTAQDISAQLLQLQNSVAHSQRVLLNSLTGSGRSLGSTSTLPASRDERKLRDLLPQ